MFREWEDWRPRFESKVSPEPNTGCWLWAGALGGEGNYGYLVVDGENVRAHVAAFFLAHGRWPTKHTLHTCDVTHCVNPAHLYEGTPMDNTNDRIRRGRARNQYGPWQRAA